MQNKGEYTFIFVKLYRINFSIWWCQLQKNAMKKENDCEIIHKKAKSYIIDFKFVRNSLIFTLRQQKIKNSLLTYVSLRDAKCDVRSC